MKVLRSLDLRCNTCGTEIRDELVEIERGAWLSGLRYDCVDTACTGVMTMFWPLGTRMALISDEKPPRDEVESARNAFVARTPGQAPVERFTGSSRSDLDAWKQRNGIIYTSTGDERARGKSVIESKSKATQTQAFVDKLAAATREAKQLVESKGEARAKQLAEIERPSEYDVNTFKQQVSNDVLPTDSVTADVAEELTPAKVAS